MNAAGLMRPLGSLYGGAVRLRATLFDRGWLHSESVPAPVLSVGNLAAGGTGKTPVTAFVARILLEAGLRPAVVSRGYGGRRGEDPLVVSNGEEINPEATADKVGDEPAMLARLLPGSPVVVARRRAEGARLAISRLGATCIVLDDGFQHLGLRRDFDLVLLDATSPFDNGRTLPAGLLREGPGALARADAIATTARSRALGAVAPSIAGSPSHDPGAGEPEILSLAKPRTPLFHFSVAPGLLMSATDGAPAAGRIPEARDSAALAGMRAVAFAGIARPHRLADDLLLLGAEVVSLLPFPDHHRFTRGDVGKILEAFDAIAPCALVTTEKDLARLRGTPHLAPLQERGLVALRIEAVLPPLELASFSDTIVRVAREGRLSPARSTAGSAP